MSKLLRVALALSFSLSALAQNHPLPGSTAEPPAICTGCPGWNSVGEVNADKPTYPYNVPLAAHVGRYVDSSSTKNVQHIGIRTIRAGIVRVNAANGRVYLGLGAAIGAYDLPTFFTTRLAEPMVNVAGINTGSAVFGRSPLERASRIDGFIYPEARDSQWAVPMVDSTLRLEDFDIDDRGYVYYQSNVFGWGIHQDDGRTDGKHLPFMVQVKTPYYASGATLFTMKHEGAYYAYTSDSEKARLYNVTVPAAPVLHGAQRTGNTHWAFAWSKNEAAKHVAVIHGGTPRKMRVYTYAALIAGGAPLVEHVPTGTLGDVAFDEAGNLWVTEYGTAGSTLFKFAASTYEKTAYPLDGSTFGAVGLHAAAGYLAIVGSEMLDASRVYDLRLLNVAGGTPQPVSTGNFFRRYYHAAPAGYAEPGSYTKQPDRPFLFVHNGLTYLFYSAYGLGDVYELGQVLRPPSVRITSASPLTGPPGGGTVVTIDGRNFGQDAVVSFGANTAATTFVSSSRLTAVAPPNAEGTVTLSVASGGQVAPGPAFKYQLGSPAALSATAAGTTSVGLTWYPGVNASSYEIFRNGVSIGTTASAGALDTGLTPDTAYVYSVRSLDAGGSHSSHSQRDLAVTTQFTDSNLIPGTTTVKAAHLADLRRAANALRVTAGLTPRTWTQSVVIRAVQLTELRTAIQEARTALGFFNYPLTDATLTGQPVKAVHVQELRNGVK
ncbi:MAG TPA: IPT/TIG domain-containing protein [Thermoanaerobaculia bacterium]|jgi:hypothetical protein